MNDFKLRDFALNYLYENYYDSYKKYFFLSLEDQRKFLMRGVLFLVSEIDDFKFEISVEAAGKINDYIIGFPEEIKEGHRKEIVVRDYVVGEDEKIDLVLRKLSLVPGDCRVYY